MKILSLSFCLSLLILASASSLLVCSLHATPPPRQLFPKLEAPGAEVQPVAYAKTTPLPSLIKKLQGLANEVQPENNQAQLLPVIVGAFLGDPTLSSVSPGHSNTVIFFDDFQEKNATILGVFKLKPNSPIPAQIKVQRLSVKEIEGWTMVTNKPELLEQIKDWSSIIKFAEWQPPTTIEFGWLLEEFHEEMSFQLKHRANWSKEMSPDPKFVMNLFLEEFGNLEAIKFSLSLLEKEIVFNLKVSARDGTELDKLFSSLPPPKNLKRENRVSQFVQSGGWMEGVMNLNFSSHAAYIEHLLVKLEKGLNDKEDKQLVTSVLSMIRKSATLYSGDSAISYRDLGDGDPLGYVQVGSTTASIADFKDLLAETNAFFQQFLVKIETFSGTGSPDFEPNFVVKESKPIDGTEVLSVKVNLEPETNGSKISSFSNQTVYYCVHEGKYIAATSRKAMKQSLRAVKLGKPLKNNLADKIILGPKHAAAWQLDLLGYGKLIGYVLKESGIDLSQWTQEIERVQEMKIPPISGNVGHGNGQYFLQTSIPSRTIRMITELVSPAYIKRANQIREKSNAREAKQSIPNPGKSKKQKAPSKN